MPILDESNYYSTQNHYLFFTSAIKKNEQMNEIQNESCHVICPYVYMTKKDELELKVRNNPSDVSSREKLGDMLYGLSEFVEAIGQYDAVLNTAGISQSRFERVHKKNMDLHLQLVDVYEEESNDLGRYVTLKRLADMSERALDIKGAIRYYSLAVEHHKKGHVSLWTRFLHWSLVLFLLPIFNLKIPMQISEMSSTLTISKFKLFVLIIIGFLYSNELFQQFEFVLLSACMIVLYSLSTFAFFICIYILTSIVESFILSFSILSFF